MNPWLSIWTQPRATIAQIVKGNPNRSLWLLAWMYGFVSLLNFFQSMTLGNSMGAVGIFITAILLAPIYGYLSFSIWSWFVTWVGALFRGQGRFKAIRCAYAWSCVPIFVNIPLWLLMVLLFGPQLFLNVPDAHFLIGWKVLALFVISLMKVVIAVWSLVIYINALAEVQQYSAIRAIFNIIVAAVILGVILFVAWSLLLHTSNSAAISTFTIPSSKFGGTL